MHYIQKHILKTLMYTKQARFSAMRPPRVDSNAYSYHLRVLQKEGLVEKTPDGYHLSPAGLFYVDKVSMENLEPRLQPKIITMIVAVNEEEEVLLHPKIKQPFIDSWMLPFGKVHLDDVSIQDAARRELNEKVGVVVSDLNHVGDCYIRAHVRDHLVWYVLAHVFVSRISKKDIADTKVRWLSASDRSALQLTPATEEIIATALDSDQFFFETFDVEWQS